MSLIIDVSNNQGYIRWDKVAKFGVKGAFLKASEGISFKDKFFQYNREQANKNGIRIGAYHFARPELHPYDPEDEAENLIRMISYIKRKDFRPVLDFESSTNFAGERAHEWCKKFNRHVKKRLGVFPIFYSYPYFIKSMDWKTPVGSGLWLADYGPNDGKNHGFKVPPPWKVKGKPWERVLLHQYSSRGYIPGVRGYCDVNFTKNILPLLAHPFKGYF